MPEQTLDAIRQVHPYARTEHAKALRRIRERNHRLLDRTIREFKKSLAYQPKIAQTEEERQRNIMQTSMWWGRTWQE